MTSAGLFFIDRTLLVSRSKFITLSFPSSLDERAGGGALIVGMSLMIIYSHSHLFALSNPSFKLYSVKMMSASSSTLISEHHQERESRQRQCHCDC